MAKQISVYLSIEALERLDEVQDFVRTTTGCSISRSSALNALCIKGARLFMADQEETSRVVAKYMPGGKNGEGAGSD